MACEECRVVKPVELNANAHQSLSWRDIALLLLVMFLWALCFPLISVGLATAPPLSFAALRAFVAGASLLVLAILWRRPFPRHERVWFKLAGVGLGTTSLGFGGMFLAGGIVSPGIATVLANSQPLIAAVLAYFVLGERLSPPIRIGLSLGFAGIILTAFSTFGSQSATNALLGPVYILLAALGVAVGNVLLKSLADEIDPLVAVGSQFVIGAVPLLSLALVFESPIKIVWSLAFTVDLLALSLFGTALVFVLWFSLMHRNRLTHLNTFTFLTPAFALVIGAFFFNERLGWLEIAGILLILSGISWVSWRG